MRFPITVVTTFAALLVTLVVAGEASAAVHCVNTTAALRNTLVAVRGDGVSDEIRIVAGDYSNDAPVGAPAYSGGIAGAENLEISGGWNTGCTAQVTGAESTVLRGAFNVPVMSLNASGGAGGLLILRRLTIAGGEAQIFGGLQVNLGTEPVSVLLDGLILRNNGSGVSAAALLVESNNAQSAVRARNLLIHGNYTVGANSTGVAVLAATGSLWVSNLTVVGNRGAGPVTGNSGLVLRCIGATCQGGLSNTVVHGNTFGSAQVERRIESDGSFQLRNNITSGQMVLSGNTAGVVASQDLTLADPRFVSPTSFLAMPGSPLINAGINLPPGGVSPVDVSGMPRVIAGTIDIGAYENELSVADTLFVNGFEAP